MSAPTRAPWYRQASVLLSFSCAVVVLLLLAGYGSWAANGGVVVDEIVVTATRFTPTPAGVPTAAPQVAAARLPEADNVDASELEVVVGTTQTVIPDLLLREDPTTEAIAQRQLAADTPVDLLEGSAEADGYSWVRVRIQDGTAGWLIADGVAP